MQPWEAEVTGADQTRMAKRADELGYDMIAVPEHFAIPREHVELSGPHYLQSTAAQAYLAGATSRIRLNSCITVLPLQHPLVLAKSLATADWMSSGRMMVTFGVGWLQQEFELLGVPFHERGRIADEYLAAIIELWTSETPRFEGRYVAFDDIAFEPKPIQKPHLPVWIGGTPTGRYGAPRSIPPDGGRFSPLRNNWPSGSSSSSPNRITTDGTSTSYTGWRPGASARGMPYARTPMPGPG